ncbi:MAG: sugar transferase [Fibrella sp.]|nr:sugar transferase [Armatimonadota bacterium]
MPMRRTSLYPILKRVFDVIVTGVALLLLAPVFLLIAIVIKVQDGGAVLFYQTRVGKDGVSFRFPKFRSMVADAEVIRQKLLHQNQHGESAVTFKLKNDPRITPVGAFLRRFSLDELPQLWCVLTGEMSLVGPRPALVVEVQQYTVTERARLAVEPGITCIWQVSGRADVPFAQQVEMDLQYIAKRSMLFDIQLLMHTIPAVLGGEGAY